MKPETEILKVHDSKDFHYEVKIEYQPRLGFATMYYKDKAIGQVDIGRILPPDGDNDYEWEVYEETLINWKERAKFDAEGICKEYFDELN